MEQPRVCEHIVPQPASAILSPQEVYRRLRVSVEYAEIKVAARVILRPIDVIRVENTVDHQICESKEQARDAARVLLELFPEQERVKHESRVGKRIFGKASF